MPTSKAQIRATNRYIARAYDRLSIVIPAGKKAELEAHAGGKGQSVNGLINDLIRQEMGVPPDEWTKRPKD